MTPVNNQQKQLLFDYCIGLASENEAVEARQLIASNDEAAEIHSKLKAVLAPLENLEPEACPDDLTESTILRLNNAARTSQLRLEQLLATEQSRAVTTKSRFWLNLGKRLVAAAVFMIVGGALITTYKVALNFARQKSWQQQCQMQLNRIFQGINNYSSDHNGTPPAVATATGAPWWKVGYPGKENHSNTRHMWLLVKNNYVNPADFVCPGKRPGLVLKLDVSKVKSRNDFPAREYVTYSFRIMCDKSPKGSSPGRKVLMADLNPLFERLPRNYSNGFRVQLNKNLLTLNSINHNRRGQNVLFRDGHVKFVKKRRIGISQDDIFTLEDTQVYKGYEVPSCEADAFVAP